MQPFRPILLLLAILAAPEAAGAQGYATMASQPDPRDFVTRSDGQLTLLGDPIRYGGADLPWLGLRPDRASGEGGPEAGLRRPSAYETNDVLQTVQMLGGALVRSRTLAGSAGCEACLEPGPGRFNDAAFAQIDQVLKQARDLGLKLVLPLAGGTGDCKVADQYGGGICGYVRWRGGASAEAFFTDPRMRADFLEHVTTVLTHVNALTGLTYADDPTILAWENCDACAGAADPRAVAAWTEAVGQAIHAHDHRHLYENGAFAGRIGPRAAAPVPASVLTPPSVDIVGDRIAAADRTGPITAREAAEAGAAVAAARRVYVVDSFGWTQADWADQPAFEDFLDRLAQRRSITAALVSGLQGHAEQGGFLPGLPVGASGRFEPALYFPALAVPGAGAAAMDLRVRAVRHFGFDMADIHPIPGFRQPDPPEIISIVNGRVAWRGAAGALHYSIERSADVAAIGSWQLVCDRCVSDASQPWQDPAVPRMPTWYRVSPTNANDHLAPPSQATPSR